MESPLVSQGGLFLQKTLKIWMKQVEEQILYVPVQVKHFFNFRISVRVRGFIQLINI